MNHKSHSVKVARIPHMAQVNLANAVLNNDRENRFCQTDESVKREICMNLMCTDSAFSIASICVYINKRVS